MLDSAEYETAGGSKLGGRFAVIKVPTVGKVGNRKEGSALQCYKTGRF